MADKETNATAGKEKRKERWLFTDEMVEELLEVLRDTKSNMAGKGLDFEGDLVKLYADVRTMMAEKFEEPDFGPKEIMRPSVEIDEMSRDEYREFKKKVDEQGRAIKLGYDRIKAKVKKLRSGFQKCVAESTRYGCGRIIKEHWDTLVAIWGGAPGAEPLEFRINTMGIPHQSQESQVAKWTPRKVKTCPQKLKMVKKQDHQNLKNKNVQQQDM